MTEFRLACFIKHNKGIGRPGFQIYTEPKRGEQRGMTGQISMTWEELWDGLGMVVKMLEAGRNGPSPTFP